MLVWPLLNLKGPFFEGFPKKYDLAGYMKVLIFYLTDWNRSN